MKISTEKIILVKAVSFVILAVGVGFILSGKIGGKDYLRDVTVNAQSTSRISTDWQATKLLALEATTTGDRDLLGLGPAEWTVVTSKDGVKVYEETWSIDKTPFGPTGENAIAINYNDTGKNYYISGFTGALGGNNKICRDSVATAARYKIVNVDDADFLSQNTSSGQGDWGGAHYGRGTVGLACGTSLDNHLTVTGAYSWALLRYADGDGQASIPITGMMIPLYWHVEGTLQNK